MVSISHKHVLAPRTKPRPHKCFKSIIVNSVCVGKPSSRGKKKKGKPSSALQLTCLKWKKCRFMMRELISCAHRRCMSNGRIASYVLTRAGLMRQDWENSLASTVTGGEELTREKGRHTQTQTYTQRCLGGASIVRTQVSGGLKVIALKVRSCLRWTPLSNQLVRSCFILNLLLHLGI